MHDTARLDDKVNTKSGGKGEKRFLQAIPHPGGAGGGHSREVWAEVCRRDTIFHTELSNFSY